ncbi:MAG: phosphoserine aminotransferase [Elusimicrobia bacterium GWA2_61_42]|nr:MAG: phosphoserine aminotransferase [Elusimicrobia bacterium GWA2_61_42]OGR78791.1 MAG: phosphoserine aminotransferase [Elusimicrobia bacterium GWC2_61_25]
MEKPALKPKCPNFSSGPCAKRPGWTVDALKNALVGRSHRSKEGKARLQEVSDRMKKVLNLPADYRIGVVAGSDTGAVELAMWTMLGTRPVDIFGWEAFGKGWMTDAKKYLKLPQVNEYKADYGQLPDLKKANPANDIIFTWNGTTSGVKVPNLDWLPKNHEGIVICDATSGVFAMEMDFTKLDVVTFSWQKVLGGEAAHGVIILSPKAVKRMEEQNARIAWPVPKIFRLVDEKKLLPGELEYSTINTPSMLCVEDAIDALKWAESIGGLPGLVRRSTANLAAFERWVEKSGWIAFLAESKEIRSNTSVCFKIKADWFQKLSDEDKTKAAKKITSLLDKEGVAKDINSYGKAPAGIRVWCGATVETSDIEALTPWLDWAYEAAAKEYSKETVK